jgi:hypothetical protein
LKLINSILGENKYTADNTKGRNKTEFCIIQEFILRRNDMVSKGNKRWFLTPQELIINKVEDISI